MIAHYHYNYTYMHQLSTFNTHSFQLNYNQVIIVIEINNYDVREMNLNAKSKLVEYRMMYIEKFYVVSWF